MTVRVCSDFEDLQQFVPSKPRSCSLRWESMSQGFFFEEMDDEGQTIALFQGDFANGSVISISSTCSKAVSSEYFWQCNCKLIRSFLFIEG